MIREDLAARFHLPPIKNYPHPTEDWYQTFLMQSDYIVSKAAEAQLLGEPIGEYADIITARKYARDCINAIRDGRYDGEEAMQEIIIEEGIPLDLE